MPRIPNVPERVKDAPAHALRAIFAGIGQALLVSDRVRRKLKGAKTDADRNKVYADYQKAMDGKRDQVVTPLVNQTRAAIEQVAKKRGLVLVIDRNNLVFGGTDVTSDVVALLKK